MTERPIPFNAPMVRAVLAGTKTQTRRVMKPQPVYVQADYRKLSTPPAEPAYAWPEHNPTRRFLDEIARDCPYGQPGDRLWVREAWRAYAAFNKTPPRDITPEAPIWYEAQDEVPFHPTAYGKLRPGMFMPRWASRITLEVTGVRVERLQDISEVDAIAEGAAPVLVPPDGGSCPHVEGYRALWESINGPGSWDANPWVWVVEFRRIDAAMGEKP